MIVYDPNQKIFSSTLINDDHYISVFGTKFLGDARHAESIFSTTMGFISLPPLISAAKARII